MKNNDHPDVRQTLREAADRAQPTSGFADRLVTYSRAARPPAIAARRRPAWWFPLLAAAAVAIIAAGVTTALTMSAGSSRVSPENSPSVRPPTSASASSSSPPSGARTLVRIPFFQQTVGVSVPSGWHLSSSQPHSCCNTPPSVCLVSGRSAYGGDPDNCVMTVTVRALPIGLTPDVPEPYPTVSCAKWRTTDESDAPIQGRPGEYRRFVNGCTGTESELWATMSAPQVVFWHPITRESSSAVAAAVVGSAQLPVVTDERRQFDEGYITHMSVSAGHYRVTIDRVVVSVDGTIIDHNPATYSYPLEGGYATTGGVEPCGGSQQDCSMSGIYRQYLRGRHPPTGTAVDGTYVQLSQTGSGYELDFFSPRSLP
jgi:hypothetical protein